MDKADTKRGALWVHDSEKENDPALTGLIDDQRVVVFKNKKWSEEEKKKQPLYFIHRAIGKTEDGGDVAGDQTS